MLALALAHPSNFSGHTIIVTFRTLIILSTFLILAGCNSAEKKSPKQERSGEKVHDIDSPSSSSGLGTKSKSKGQIYKVQKTKPLELPPDLLGTSNDTVQENVESYSSDEERVLPQIEGARIVDNNGDRWLEVDSDAETAWKAMTEFWSLSGITLVDYNPEAGIMETEWIEEAQNYDEESSVVKNLIKDIFRTISSRKTALDKYRIRFERTGDNKTELHVTHRWIAKKEAGEDNLKKVNDFEWVELPTDSNRVNAFLQNIVLLFDQTSNS